MIDLPVTLTSNGHIQLPGYGSFLCLGYTKNRGVYQLNVTATGAQPISSLSGVNTLMTDANSVTVTGRADPIKRIIDLEDAVASMTNT